MPLSGNTNAFDWDTRSALGNDAYRYNPLLSTNRSDAADRLKEESSRKGLTDGFWRNGYYLSNDISFNVNSTSVNAWITYLSGLRDLKRDAAKGEVGGAGQHVFSRFRRPLFAQVSGAVDPAADSAYDGGRILTDDEIVTLAHFIVGEVKQRGPFLSIADFVNRRLGDSSDESTKMGALEAAIQKSGINDQIEIDRFKPSTDVGWSNNHPDWAPDYNRQASSKAWGLPSHLIQSDILTPIAPIISVRGDVFTIRAYGEALDENGEVMARAYLEAEVVRTPDYVNNEDFLASSVGSGKNRPTTPSFWVKTVSGEYAKRTLNGANERLGRKFVVVQTRWVSPNEI